MFNKKSHKLTLFTALIIAVILKLTIFLQFNNDYMGGDANTYEALALSERLITPSEYFNAPPEYLKDIQSPPNSDVFPYSGVSRTQYWEPGYPLLLSLLYKISPSRNLVRLFQHIFMLLTLLVWVLIFKNHTINKFQIALVVMTLIHPFFVAYPQLIYTETIDSFLISLNYLFFLKEHKKFGSYTLWGFTLGFFTITESYYLPFSLFIILHELYKNQSKKFIAAFSLAFMLILAPVLYNNYLYTDGGIILATKSSNNIWVSNNNMPILKDQAPWPVPADYFKNKEKYPDIRPPCTTTLKDQNSCEVKNALVFIFQNPFLFLKRAVIKFSNLWSPHIFPMNRGFNEQAIGLSQQLSKWLYRGFMLFESLIMLIFFFSLCLLIFQKKTKLHYAIFCHLIFFHGIISIGHGLIRFKHGLMPVVFATIFLAFNQENGSLIKKRNFQLTAILILILILMSLLFQLNYYWKV